MKHVELHIAYLWTCDDCGRDNFERAIQLDPEAVAERTRSDPGSRFAERVLAANERFGFPESLPGFWVVNPTEVTCGHCGAQFDSHQED